MVALRTIPINAMIIVTTIGQFFLKLLKVVFVRKKDCCK
jgi:hypothetical protein